MHLVIAALIQDGPGTVSAPVKVTAPIADGITTHSVDNKVPVGSQVVAGPNFAACGVGVFSAVLP